MLGAVFWPHGDARHGRPGDELAQVHRLLARWFQRDSYHPDAIGIGRSLGDGTPTVRDAIVHVDQVDIV